MGARVNLFTKQIQAALATKVSLVVEAVAMEVWNDAKQNHIFNNQTGELEKSIRVQKIKKTKTVVHYQVQAGVGKTTGIGSERAGSGGSNKAYYAIYVELGTRKMGAKPFLRPAYLAVQPKLYSILKRIFESSM